MKVRWNGQKRLSTATPGWFTLRVKLENCSEGSFWVWLISMDSEGEGPVVTWGQSNTREGAKISCEEKFREIIGVDK